MGRLLFGDRIGFTVFVGALVFYIAYWRVDFFITDSLTIANTLVNVADGHLAVTETPYSLTFGTQPGLVQVGDQFFGRNYGHVFLAVPLLWMLDWLRLLVDPRILVAGLWSLLVLVFARQIALLSDRRWIRKAGAVLALLLFVGNAITVTEFPPLYPPDRLALVALQLTTMVAAGVTATFIYRLVARVEGQRVGAAAGAAVVLASPVSFWASIPKRHALTTAVVAIVLYCFAASREPGKQAFRARLGLYALPGLYTLVHPFEAVFILLVVGPLDLLSAPTNSVRKLGAVAVVFFLSVVPLFVVNTLISGNPLKPPRMLPTAGPGAELPSGPDLGVGGSEGGSGTGGGGGGTGSGGSGTGSGGGGTDGSQSTGGGGSTGDGSGGGADGGTGRSDTGRQGDGSLLKVIAGPVTEAVSTTNEITSRIRGSVSRGIDAFSEPNRLYHVFIRSGWVPSISYGKNAFEAIELALLESFPLLVALPAVWRAGLKRLRRGLPVWPSTPARWTDILGVALVVVFAVLYLPYLPLHSQITPRYILLIVPALVYLLARIPAVKRPIEVRPAWLVGSYATTVLAGGVVLVAVLTVIDPAIGEAMQFHALLALATGGIGLLALASRPFHRDARVATAGLALPAGATTLFLLLSAIEYFNYGPYALGLAQALNGLVPII